MSLETTPIVIDAPVTLGQSYPLATQAEAEAGTETARRSWSPLRIKQAIEALAGTGGPLNNFAATTDPGVGDDSGDGYGVGSVWINVTLDRIWQCQSASVGAAVWERLDETLQHNLSATTDPGVGDDSADGYSVGSKWVNVSLDKVFECLDASVGAAVWDQTNGASGFSDPTIVRGDIIVRGVSGLERVAMKGLNQVLTGNGTDALPLNPIEWISISIFGASTGPWDEEAEEHLLFVPPAPGKIVYLAAESYNAPPDFVPIVGITIGGVEQGANVSLGAASSGGNYLYGSNSSISVTAVAGAEVDLSILNPGNLNGTEVSSNANTGFLRVRLGFRRD